MKPLVVLLLVVGALGALLFALTSLTDRGAPRGGPVEPPVAAVRPTEKPEPHHELTDPTLPAAASARPTEGDRQALSEDEGGAQAGERLANGTIQGEVVDPQGNPIAGARISLTNSRVSQFDDVILSMRDIEPPRPLAKAETDATGAFRFAGLDPKKPWTLIVAHDTYRPTEAGPIEVPEGGTWNERIELQPGQTFSGTVRNAQSGAAIAGAKLVVDSPVLLGKKKSPSRTEATTGADGVFVFPNVKAGQFALTVSAPGFATQMHSNFSLVEMGEAPKAWTNRQPAPGLQSKTQDFELQPGKLIAGRVIGPDRAGMAGIEVEALNQSGTVGCQSMATSGKNGEFLLEGLAEGLYTVRITHDGYESPPKQRVEAGETNVVLELAEQAAVIGKVVDPQGRPLENFTVKARMSNEVSKNFGAVARQRAIKNSKDGSFELKGIPEGSYVIEALAPGYSSSFSEPFNATQGLVTSDVVVRMSLGGSLSGRVVDAYGGTPLSGIEVATQENNWMPGDIFELFGALEPSALSKASVRTDAEGRFTFELLTPGEYQIQFRGKGFSPLYTNDVKVEDGQRTEMPVTILSKGAVITGVVYGRDEKIAPGADVQLNPTDPNLMNGGRTTRTDATGRYKIENAQPGSYLLAATRPNASVGNPFEIIGDLRQSQIEISIEDGGVYEFELHMGGPR